MVSHSNGVSITISCQRLEALCRALGIYIDEDGKRHFALSDEIKPFTFRFKKAEEWASNAEEEDKSSPTSFSSSSLVRIFSKCCI
ncbi:Miraculin [Quillaja saponaria]|uniref:Miraculin n=1 Tax=Quillaja saponaria TaxID=32244 RepID=A0AAD7Q6K4_QUISA|nr:Miraculin [Quillaja saponaria]